MFEDTKGIGKLRNYIQYNGQRKGIKGQIIMQNYTENKRLVNTNPLKTGSELRWSGRVSLNYCTNMSITNSNDLNY